MGSPEEIVRAEMAAWGRLDVDEVMSHFAEDAVWDIGPSYPVLSGRDAIRKAIEAYFSSGATYADFEILHLAVDRDVVLMERFDHWIVNGEAIDTPVMGAYEVKDQKITAWREYFIPPENP
jgi:limonene-1,2-epoxide hydrolase